MFVGKDKIYVKKNNSGPIMKKRLKNKLGAGTLGRPMQDQKENDHDITKAEAGL